MLRTAATAVDEGGWTDWVSIGAASAAVDPSRRRRGVAAALEGAFDAEAERWWTLGRQLGHEPSAMLAHAPSCAANPSDLGVMLAWSNLVRQWAGATGTTLVLCDDPWLFRHLRGLPGVDAGNPPPLWRRQIALTVRGYLARSRAAARFAIASWRSRVRYRGPPAASWLLVYGHPASSGDGEDGYFGDLMQHFPDLRRILHVDCPIVRARALAVDGRTMSLHGFGKPIYALLLPFCRWRPSRVHRRGEYGWLIRRAAALEGGTGQAAAIRWQDHCQTRWLARCRPKAVAWPWENHGWERAFVRRAHAAGTATIGYQHSVVGRQMLNYAAHANVDGLASLPDRALCTGISTRDQLLRWGHRPERVSIGGALRFRMRRAPAVTAGAPVFVALPFDGCTAAEMVAAVRQVAGEAGARFLVKDHPMTPYAFRDSPGVSRTDLPLERQEAVSSVLYAATTVGLESLLAGIPTIRFRPAGRIALDILPEGVNVPAAEAETLGETLQTATVPATIDPTRIFAPVDLTLWGSALRLPVSEAIDGR